MLNEINQRERQILHDPTSLLRVRISTKYRELHRKSALEMFSLESLAGY